MTDERSPRNSESRLFERRYRHLTRPRFDADANVYRMRYDAVDRRTLLAEIALGIAEIADVDVASIDPLYETVDAEVLARLGDAEEPEEMTFTAGDCEIAIRPGEACVRPPIADGD